MKIRETSLVRLFFSAVQSGYLIYSPNVVLILAHRLRRWPNIKTTLDKCLVHSGWNPVKVYEWTILGQRRLSYVLFQSIMWSVGWFTALTA